MYKRKQLNAQLGIGNLQTSLNLFPLNLGAKFWPMCLSEARAGTELYS